ncbi:MAG: spore coat protein [Desulfitobacteriaceae bacterium]|nr:spore coat protein [Desulfitobacteriaceae bacterium]MDI6916128.1 spore coat protein [Desulfitobacteriaceae bacterium]
MPINMTDPDVAHDLLKDSKFALHSLSTTITETNNPLMREMLLNILNTTIDAHYKLSDLAISKNWYQPNLAPLDMLKQDIAASQSLT